MRLVEEMKGRGMMEKNTRAGDIIAIYLRAIHQGYVCGTPFFTWLVHVKFYMSMARLFYMARAREILHVCDTAFFYMARAREILHVCSTAFFYMTRAQEILHVCSTAFFTWLEHGTVYMSVAHNFLHGSCTGNSTCL
jgi:hypothetical protein